MKVRVTSLLVLSLAFLGCSQKSSSTGSLTNLTSNASSSVGSPTPNPTAQPTPQPTVQPSPTPTKTPTPVPPSTPQPTPTPAPTVTPQPTPSPTPQSGVPLPQSASQATFNHKQSVTINGVNFGTRSVPIGSLIFDDASGVSLSQKWDYTYPTANDSTFQIKYRAPSEVTVGGNVVGGIALPHNRIQKYIAGAHYTSGAPNANAGYMVALGKNNIQTVPYSYISYYRAIDPRWHTNTCSTPGDSNCDQNFKDYDYSIDNGPYGANNFYFSVSNISDANVNWNANYAEFGQLTIFSVNTALINWYPSTGLVFGQKAAPSPRVGWQKVEFIMKHASQDGFHNILQDNQLIWQTSMKDDNIVGGTRSETIGGYAREYGNTDVYKNNWRYFADVYYDRSLARVVLANNADYTKATIIEPQPVQNWTSTSAQVQVNLGRLPAGSTAYIFIFNESNVRSSAGFPIQVGP